MCTGFVTGEQGKLVERGCDLPFKRQQPGLRTGQLGLEPNHLVARRCTALLALLKQGERSLLKLRRAAGQDQRCWSSRRVT